MTLPWNFEPADPEDACDPSGQPWAHAVRGRREAGRIVTGYGHTPPAADYDARHKAAQFDAREVLGIPHEAPAQPALTIHPNAVPMVMRSLGTNYAVIDNTVQWIGNQYSDADIEAMRHEIKEWFSQPRTFRDVYGWPVFDMPFMPIGT